MSCYTRCIPLDAYYEEVLRDTPGFKHQALPRHKARPKSPKVKSEKSERITSRHNSDSSPDLSTLYTWADEIIVDEKVGYKPHRWSGKKWPTFRNIPQHL
jgi:hypothetical protein